MSAQPGLMSVSPRRPLRVEIDRDVNVRPWPHGDFFGLVIAVTVVSSVKLCFSAMLAI